MIKIKGSKIQMKGSGEAPSGDGAEGEQESSSDDVSVKEGKWDYFFGRVKSNPHNEARSAQNARDLETLGIKESEGGRDKLMALFREGLKKPDKSSHVSEFGTTVTRTVEVPPKGCIDVKYFYAKGEISAVPEVSTIIPKVFK